MRQLCEIAESSKINSMRIGVEIRVVPKAGGSPASPAVI